MIKLWILDCIIFSLCVCLEKNKIIPLVEDSLSFTCYNSSAPTRITDTHEFHVGS